MVAHALPLLAMEVRVIEVERSALVPFAAAHMFDLVDDVTRYPEFLPWCTEGRIELDDQETRIATLEIEIARVRQRFSTRNIRKRPERIELQLQNGPFRTLEGLWTFRSLGEHGCKIALSLRFEPQTRLLDFAFRHGFHQIADRMVDDFCRHARHRHA